MWLVYAVACLQFFAKCCPNSLLLAGHFVLCFSFFLKQWLLTGPTTVCLLVFKTGIHNQMQLWAPSLLYLLRPRVWQTLLLGCQLAFGTASSTAVHSWAQFLAHPGEDRQPNCHRQVCGFMRPVFSQQCSDWAATSPPTSKSRGLWRLFFGPSFFPFPYNKTHDLVIAKVSDCTMKPWSNQKSNFLSFGSHFE